MGEDPRVFSDEECWDFLRSQRFGRLAFHEEDEVHITPVNFAVDGRTLLFRTAAGSKLIAVVINANVAFEVDELGDRQARSVVVRGTARLLGEAEARRADAVELRAWVGAWKDNVVEITPVQVTGREFDLVRT